MGDVVVGHGEHRHLSHRAGAAVDHARPLVEGGQIRVEVGGEALAGGDLPLGGGELAQGLAVGGHVGEHHQHVVAVLKGQELRRRQGAAGGEDALDDGVGGQVEEHDHPAQGAGLLEGAAEELGGVVLDAHGGEDNGELPVLVGHLGLPHDLGGQLVVLHAGAGEDGQLLPPDEGGAAVDGGYAGVDAASRVLAGDGVDGGAVDVAPLLRVDLAQGVDGAARAVEHPAQHLLGQGDVHALAGEVGGGVLQRDAPGALKYLENHPVAVNEDDAAIAALPVLQSDLRHLVVGHVLDPLQGDEGAGQEVEGVGRDVRVRPPEDGHGDHEAG